jgi:hypothetical protein
MKTIILIALTVCSILNRSLAEDSNNTALRELRTLGRNESIEFVTEVTGRKDLILLGEIAGDQALNWRVRAMAISGIGRHGSKNDAGRLLPILESVKHDAIEGGTEQQNANRELKDALVDALSKICDVEAPRDRSEAALLPFIEACRATTRT